MIISSPAFGNNEPIPNRYTCDGKNVNPPLEFFEVPEDADSLVLVMLDPDAPNGTFYHWVLWNINPGFDGIGEGNTVEGSEEGVNSGGKKGYLGPCPPSGLHHYVFNLYAITGNIPFAENAPPWEIEETIKGRVVAQGTLVGTYGKE